MDATVGSKKFFQEEIDEIKLDNVLNEDRIWNFLENEGSLGEPEEDVSWIDIEEGQTYVFGQPLELEGSEYDLRLPVLDFSTYSESYKQISGLIENLMSLNPDEEEIMWTGKALGHSAVEAALESLESHNSPQLDRPALVLMSDLDRKSLEEFKFGSEYEGDALDVHNKYLGDDMFHIESSDGEIDRAGTITSDPTAILYHLGNYVYKEHYSTQNQEFLKNFDKGLLMAAEEYKK